MIRSLRSVTPCWPAKAVISFIYALTMPVVRNASGQGAASWPAKYAPSSDTSRHVSPDRAEVTSASFWNPDKDRTNVRTASPLRFSGALSPISVALPT